MSAQEVIFDKQDQLDKIWDWVIPGETLYAIYDCKGAGTGFVGITDRPDHILRQAVPGQEEGDGHRAPQSNRYYQQ